MGTELSSGGVCPSNTMTEGRAFPNLARRTEGLPPEALEAVFKEVDAAVRAELKAAGLPESDLNAGLGWVEMPELTRKCPNGCYKEVPTRVIGFWKHWMFERDWYYYRAKGDGIPPEFSVLFDVQWGRQVRAEGDCACRGPEHWNEGFATGSYHIDTPEGLASFIRLLGRIHSPRREEEKA